jgi:uncharacterized protein
MNNLEIVKLLYAAFRDRNTETILQIFDPQIVWIHNEGFPGGGKHIGAEVVLNDVFAKLRAEWDTWQAIVEEWLDANDTIIALGEYRATHRSTGKSTRAAFAHVYRLQDGRITKFQQYVDTVKVAEAMQSF